MAKCDPLRRLPVGSPAQIGFGPEAFGGVGILHIFQVKLLRLALFSAKIIRAF